MLDFKADIKKTVDTKKIHDFVKKCNYKILVGFPAGEEHVPADYRTKEEKAAGVELQTMETAELARTLHYGGAGIPPRPFMDDGIEQNEDKICATLKKELQKAKDGDTPNYNKVGAVAVGGIVKFISGDYYRDNIPNSKETADRKGSDKPLIDSGNMKNSLTFIVEGKK